ncbi:MAG: trigger factor [Candidatus Omnitrophica bacterium]|nr:trigger factor [Candidatus Omnitrophota bacterium]MDD5436691.1 trigger factor [Candidatus Omnitrophota bacterium]
MKSKIKSVGECASLLEITVPQADIEKAFGEVYGEIAKYAVIPGFRAGKAPVELVKKHYEKNAREEVLKRLIPEAYRDAVLEHKIFPVGMPEISDVSFEGEAKLSFSAKVDTRPVFKLKNYKGLKVEKKSPKVSDGELDKMLDNLRELNAKYVAVEDRPAQMGDYVVSDLDCSVDGKPAHKKRENLWLLLEKDSLVPVLIEKMVGMNKGEERDIEANIPEKHPDKTIAGKLAKYHVKAREIKKRELHELNDEFAKIFGKEKLDDLKTEILRELEARAKANAEIDVENQLLNKIIEDNVFAVPSNFVARQLDFMVEDAKKHLMQKGFKKEDLDKKDNEFKERFKGEAVRKVRLLFILDSIGREEKIEAADGDLIDAYKTISAQSGKGEEEVRQFYEREDLVEDLKDKIREGKVIQFLLQNADVTKKD